MHAFQNTPNLGHGVKFHVKDFTEGELPFAWALVRSTKRKQKSARYALETVNMLGGRGSRRGRIIKCVFDQFTPFNFQSSQKARQNVALFWSLRCVSWW